MPVTGVEEVHEAEEVSATGDANVDAVIGGVRWVDLDDDGVFEVSFSFGSANSVYGFDEELGYETGDDFNEPTFDMFSLSDDAKDLFYGIVDNIESFTNLDLVEVEETETNAGTVRIVWSEISDEDAVGWAYYPGDWWGAGDIWLIAENHDEDDVDFLHTMIHELGHALGLKHSFEEDGDFPAIASQFEGVEYTVMSYTVSARFPEATYADLWPQTFMYWDIKALQEMYGVDTTTTAGTDTYQFDQSERYLMTVWDYGGTDTIEVTNGSTGVHIDLSPGSWSNVGTTIEYYDGSEFFYDSYTVYIADDTTIENAFGAGGDDTILGNDADNVLRGGAGDDWTSGGAGNDQLWAGSEDLGNDTLLGGAGNDTLGGAVGDDSLLGGDGDDLIWAGAGNDTLHGGADNDVLGARDGDDALYGDGGNDALWAGSGSDNIDGGAGADQIGAGLGDDTIYGGEGNDTISGGQDTGDTGLNDVIFAEGGNDIVYASVGNDSIDGGAGADDLYAGAGSDTVNGDSGNDTIGASGGNDTLTGGSGDDLFVFGDSSGDDLITDFTIDEDTLDLSGTVTDFSDAASVTAAASNTAGGLLIDLGGGNSVLLEGLTTADIEDMALVL